MRDLARCPVDRMLAVAGGWSLNRARPPAWDPDIVDTADSFIALVIFGRFSAPAPKPTSLSESHTWKGNERSSLLSRIHSP